MVGALTEHYLLSKEAAQDLWFITYIDISISFQGLIQDFEKGVARGELVCK